MPTLSAVFAIATVVLSVLALIVIARRSRQRLAVCFGADPSIDSTRVLAEIRSIERHTPATLACK